MRPSKIPAATSSGVSAGAPSGPAPASTVSQPLHVEPSDVELRMITASGSLPVLNTPKMNSVSLRVAAATAEAGGNPEGTLAHGPQMSRSEVEVTCTWFDEESLASGIRR